MKTYIIYDRKTGEVLQTHVQMDDVDIDPEHLIKIARPESPAETVDVMLVEDLAPDTRYRVDLKAKKLAPVEEGKARGSGGALAQPSGGDPRLARTVVVQIGEKKQ